MGMGPRWSNVLREPGADLVQLSVVADMLEAQGLIWSEQRVADDVAVWSFEVPDGGSASRGTKLQAAAEVMESYEHRWFLEKAREAGFRPHWLKEGEELPTGLQIGDWIDCLNTLRRGVALLDLSLTLYNGRGVSAGLLKEVVQAIGDIARELADCLQLEEEPFGDLKDRHQAIERLAEVAGESIEHLRPVSEGKYNFAEASELSLQRTYRIGSALAHVVRLIAVLPNLLAARGDERPLKKTGPMPPNPHKKGGPDPFGH